MFKGRLIRIFGYLAGVRSIHMILASTHGAGGILILYLISFFLKIPLDNKLFLFAIFMSDIADIDFIFYGIRHTFKLDRYSHRHRRTLLHSTPLYWMTALFIYFFASGVYAIVFLGASFMHLILDTISKGWGIRWLWPFKDTRYRIKFSKLGVEKFSEWQLPKIVRARGDDNWFINFWRIRNCQLWFEIGMSLFFFEEVIRVLFYKY